MTVQSRTSQVHDVKTAAPDRASSRAREQPVAIPVSPSSTSSSTTPPAAASAAWSAARSARCRTATAPIHTSAQAAALEASRIMAMAQMVADPA